MSIKDALKALKLAVENCERCPSFSAALDVCRKSRDVWDAFDLYALSNSGDEESHSAKVAVKLLARAVSAMELIQPLPDEQDALRLRRFIKSITARKEDLQAFADGGVEGFRQITVKSAMSLFPAQLV